MADLKLFWDTYPGISSFTVSYKLATAPTYTVVTSIMTNYYTITGLTPCVDYDVKIQAICTSGGGITTGPKIINIADGTCGAKFTLQSNNTTAGDLYKISQVQNANSGVIVYSPQLSGGAAHSDSNIVISPNWTSPDFIVTVINTTFSSQQFYLKVYNNTTLVFDSTSSPTTIVSSGVLYFVLPTSVVDGDNVNIFLYVV